MVTGASAVRLIQNQWRTLVGGSLGNGGRLDTLSEIGVSFQSDGTLKLDTAKLQTALSTDSDAVTQLFAAALRQHDSDGVVGFPAKTGVSGVSPWPRA